MPGVARPHVLRVADISYPNVAEDEVVQSLVEETPCRPGGSCCRQVSTAWQDPSPRRSRSSGIVYFRNWVELYSSRGSTDFHNNFVPTGVFWDTLLVTDLSIHRHKTQV